MDKVRLKDEQRLRDLSRIANMAHKYGSLEKQYTVTIKPNSLKKLDAEFKKSSREQKPIQDKLYLSYGL